MKRGRPLLEDKPLDTEIHIRVTAETAAAIDKHRGKQTRAGWIRGLIKEVLK